jgi:hypothetical protein
MRMAIAAAIAGRIWRSQPAGFAGGPKFSSGRGIGLFFTLETEAQ